MAEDLENERIQFSLRREPHRRKWHRAKDKVASNRDVDPDELTNPEVADEALGAYLLLERLRDDRRVQQAIEAVATDHGLEPSDVSIENLVKITSGAYTGYAQTADWETSGEEAVKT